MSAANTSPFFSVIVPVFNRAELVCETVNSILGQQFFDFELILVDDGSTDNTIDVLRSFRDERVKIFQKQNGERAVARNYGAQRSAGKYLIFFDSDDIMFPDHLLKAQAFLLENKMPPLGYAGYKYTTDEGVEIKTVLKKPANFRKAIAVDNFLGCSSVFVRRDVFMECPFNEDRKLITSEDKELWLRMAARWEFTFMPQVSFAIVEHPGRSLNNISADQCRERGEAYLKALWSDEKFLKAYKKYLGLIRGMEYALVALMYAAEGKKLTAKGYLKKAFLAYPLIITRKRFLAALRNSIK